MAKNRQGMNLLSSGNGAKAKKGFTEIIIIKNEYELKQSYFNRPGDERPGN